MKLVLLLTIMFFTFLAVNLCANVAVDAINETQKMQLNYEKATIEKIREIP